MINKQNLIKNTSVIFVLLLFVAVSGMTMVAYADNTDDENVVHYNVSEDDAPNVPYLHYLSVTGEEIEQGDNLYVVDENDEYVLAEEADENDSVLYNTGDLEASAALGDYTLVNATPEGEVNVSESDGDSVYVSEASANVDYQLRAYDDDSEEIHTTQLYNAEDDVESLEIDDGDWSGVEDEDNVTVVLYTEDAEELDSETVQVDESVEYDGQSEQDAITNEGESAFISTVGEFSVDFEDAPQDVRLEQGVFEDGETTTLDRVWLGQELILTDTEGVIEEGQYYDIHYVDSDGDEQFIREIAPEEYDGIAELAFEVDSDFSDEIGNSTGDFQLSNSSQTFVEWETQEQDLNVTTSDVSVNQKAEETDVSFNLSSVRGGPYDVIISSEDVEQLVDEEDMDEEAGEVMVDLIDESELRGGLSVTAEENDDGDMNYTRVSGVVTVNDIEELVMDFGEIEEGEYTFNFDVADTTAEDDATVNVFEGEDGAAQFDESVYQQVEGDVLEMTLDLTSTDRAEFVIAESDYELSFEVEDGSDSGDVTILMDTYRAGDEDYGIIDDGSVEGGVFYTDDEDDEIHVESNELPDISDPIGLGSYALEAYVAGEETDIATMDIVERHTGDMNVYTMPDDEADATMSDFDSYATERMEVAEDDWLVLEVGATGLYSPTMLTDDTHPAAFVDYDERHDVDGPEDLTISEEEFTDLPELNVHLESEEQRNRNVRQLMVENAAELEVDSENKQFYLFFDTSDDIFTSETSQDDYFTEYNAHFNVTEEHKFRFDEDDSDRHETENEFEHVEREIVPTLPVVESDSSPKDRVYGVENVEDSVISADTTVAPGTEYDVRFRSESIDLNDSVEEPILETVETTVTDNETIEATYNLSGLSVDRDATIQFHPYQTGSDRFDAVMIEEDAPPQITEINAETPVTAGEEVTFSSEVAYSNVDELSYEWNFDDGETARIEEPTHVFDEAGTYNVSLTVTDDQDREVTETVEVVVEEAPVEPPEIVDVIYTEEGEVGEELEFTVSALDTEFQDELTYDWDFGDNTNTQGSTVTHSYDQEGTYDVTVTVSNPEESVEETVTVSIEDTEPEVMDYELEVTAVDAESGDVVEGAFVTVEQDGEEVESGEADENGFISMTLEEGDYDVTVQHEDYEAFDATVDLDEDTDFTAELQPIDDGGDENGDDDDDPEQPGFTLLMALTAIATIAGAAYYRTRFDN